MAESIILTAGIELNQNAFLRGVNIAAANAEKRLGNIRANIDTGGLNKVSSSLGRLNSQATEFNKSLEASNARVLAFGASAGAIFAVQKGLQAVVRDAIEVEKVLADINSVLNQTASGLQKFSNEIFKSAKQTGTSFKVAADAALELSRQGLNAEATTKRLNASLILARLGGIEAKDAVEGLTAAINSFTKEALDDVTVVNKLANVAAKFAVSERDLTEAIKRSASAASDAGVSFDELVSLVTSAQQTTARGGAVIGNALKTIFTRVQRSDTLDQLEAIGVATRKLNGDFAGAPTIMKNLAIAYDDLGQEQKSFISELVGGGYQINQLKAQLGDLSKEYGFYARALETAKKSTNEAIIRNEELNKTTAASLNSLMVSITEANAAFGSAVFGKAIKQAENIVGGIVGVFEGGATDAGKAFLGGLGSMMSGPGMAIITAGLVAVFMRLGSFALDAGKAIIGNLTGLERQRQVQEQIQNILIQSGASYDT